MFDFQIPMADFASGGGALGLPGVTQPANTPTAAGYNATPINAAGVSAATADNSTQWAGLLGSLLTPFAAALGSNLKTATPTNPAPASGGNSPNVILWIALGIAALIAVLFLIRKA